MNVDIIFDIANLLALFYFVDSGFRDVGRDCIDAVMGCVVCDVVGVDGCGIYIPVESYDHGFGFDCGG